MFPPSTFALAANTIALSSFVDSLSEIVTAFATAAWDDDILYEDETNPVRSLPSPANTDPENDPVNGAVDEVN